jgi:hypothetical protein
MEDSNFQENVNVNSPEYLAESINVKVLFQAFHSESVVEILENLPKILTTEQLVDVVKYLDILVTDWTFTYKLYEYFKSEIDKIDSPVVTTPH